MADVKAHEPGSVQVERLDSTAAMKHLATEEELRAMEAVTTEHSISVREAIKKYPWALFWSVMVSMCVIMEGYQTSLTGNFFAYPAFTAKYGQYVDEKGRDQVTAAWQAATNNASGVGAFFGALLNGYLVNIFGQKHTVIGALCFLSGAIFVTFFAPRIEFVMLGELLSGLPWGVFATSAPAYASEVLPLKLRVYMTGYTNMCFIIGIFITSGVLAGLNSRTDQWAYRIPFALQWIWPAFLIPSLCFAPESPWHLVRKGKLDQAEKTLRRLRHRDTSDEIKAALAHIVHTNELEMELAQGTRYRDCFKGTELRRTEIACMTFVNTVLCGSTFAGNSTYFFQQVDLSTRTIYNLSLGQAGLSLLGALGNWFLLVPYFGRRRVYLAGMVAMGSILVLIGILHIFSGKSDSIPIAQAGMTLLWVLVSQLTIAQLGWVIPSEIGSTRLRQKTVCVARNAYYIANVIANVLNPYFMNPREWNLKGYTGFVWAGTAVFGTVWLYFRLPETKDRTYEELDWLFAKNTPTRKFKTTQVDVFDHEARQELTSHAGINEAHGEKAGLEGVVNRLVHRKN